MTVTVAKGFEAGGWGCGIKPEMWPDLAIVTTAYIGAPCRPWACSPRTSRPWRPCRSVACICRTDAGCGRAPSCSGHHAAEQGRNRCARLATRGRRWVPRT